VFQNGWNGISKLKTFRNKTLGSTSVRCPAESSSFITSCSMSTVSVHVSYYNVTLFFPPLSYSHTKSGGMYGAQSALGPKISDSIFSVHLNKQDSSGGSRVFYSPPPMSRYGYPRLPNHQWLMRTLNPNCHSTLPLFFDSSSSQRSQTFILLLTLLSRWVEIARGGGGINYFIYSHIHKMGMIQDSGFIFCSRHFFFIFICIG
jgi:hypothetical protein